METPPRLLFDTNIWVHLAQGKLGPYENRLTLLADSELDLIWLPEIAILELLAPLSETDSRAFGEIVSALLWADRLAGNRLAEGYDYALRVGAATGPFDKNAQVRQAVNLARQKLIGLHNKSELSSELLDVSDFMKRVRDRQRSQWVARFERLAAEVAANAVLNEDKVEDRVFIERIVRISAESFAEVADRHRAEHGAARSLDEIRTNLREFIHFDVAVILKMLGREGYDFEGHQTDFHDWLLCSYPALGYTVVTGDKRLVRALERARCPSSRVCDLDDGLELVERWLANRELNLRGAGAPAGQRHGR